MIDSFNIPPMIIHDAGHMTVESDILPMIGQHFRNPPMTSQDVKSHDRFLQQSTNDRSRLWSRDRSRLGSRESWREDPEYNTGYDEEPN